MTDSPSHPHRWHILLTSRYVCTVCLTRFFEPHRCCTACHAFDSIEPLSPFLSGRARSEAELRALMAESRHPFKN